MLILYFTSPLYSARTSATSPWVQCTELVLLIRTQCTPYRQDQQFTAPGYQQATATHKERCPDQTHTEVKDRCKL
eukprot:1162098-Pelagomonas_calceolata.AAC.13